MCVFTHVFDRFKSVVRRIKYYFMHTAVILIFNFYFFSGQNLVPEQKIKNEEDHEKRRASTGAQPQLQRPHGLQLSTVSGRLGHTGSFQAAQPTATKHQHDGF